jgi:PST family polysaccharide transporter
MALARTARSGLLWTYSGGALALLLQLGYTATTARALPPSAFGPFAASQAVILLLGYLSLTAVAAAVTRRVALTPALIGSAWTLTFLGGGLAALAALCGSSLWARLWNLPDAALLVVASSPAVLLGPPAALSLALLRQQMRYRPAAAAELAGTATGLGVTGVLVAVTRQPWLLPLALGLSALTTLVVACAARREWPHLGWSRPDVRDLVAFAGAVGSQNLVYGALNTWPQFVVSRLYGPTTLAHLNRSVMIVTLPQNQLSSGLMKVLYPVFSRLRDRPVERREATTSALVMCSGVAAVLFGTLAGSATPVVRLLLGDRWLPVAPLVPLVALGAVGYVLMGLASNVMESAGRLRHISLTQLSLATALLSSSLALWTLGRLTVPAVLCAFALSQALAHALQILLFARAGDVDVRRVLGSYSTHLAVGAGVGVALHATADAAQALPAVLAACVQAAAIAAVVLVLASCRQMLPLWTTASALGLVGRDGSPARAVRAGAERRSGRRRAAPPAARTAPHGRPGTP